MAREIYPTETRHEAKINGRSVFLHVAHLDIGDLFVVEHEDIGLMLIDDYIGRDEEKAETIYKRAVKRIVNGNMD